MIPAENIGLEADAWANLYQRSNEKCEDYDADKLEHVDKMAVTLAA
ncbi:hypothetical protein GRI58_07435 [Porphyrobacter algicida]|uniref:Uncharacterized protein n=1 Tax=Qipengyuania algicida TaxID=1836209 RepID=A0A845AEI0_9SPHN|nr:hypothetical protein [Qipengyuania algicida]MXP28650.1 hypothetical protein [Qipengyuania algicida]